MHYHVVGIAGAGMSAIANLLLDQGHTVSGSDPTHNRLSNALVARGATVFVGHSPAHVRGADALVATAAVRADHPELVAAHELGIPVLKRGDLWRDWSQQRRVVAVAGSHGKTTTSAMIAVALRGAGMNPGYLIGAEVPDLGGNAAWGNPDAPLVIEADEYDRAFLSLRPDLAVITNIEWDHPDIYPNAAEYADAFAQFAASVTNPRNLVLCGDDAGVAQLHAPESSFYGIEERLASDPVSCRLAPLDWTASGVTATPTGGVSFDLWRYDRRRMGQRRAGAQELALPGLHNVRNALAALAVAALLGADMTGALAALANFRGSARRFELRGEIGGVTVIDDYGHHPSEVRATLAAAQMRYPGRRIVAYLQPHTFSRTTALLDQWPDACLPADILLVGNIYAAREQGDPVALAHTLAERVAAAGVDARYSGDVETSAAILVGLVHPGDVVITLGAGDGERVGMELLTYMGGAAAGVPKARLLPRPYQAPPIPLIEAEPMARHTSWQIGGPARYYAEVHSVEQARALVAWACKVGVEMIWVGGGTNLLVRDTGFPGLIARYRAQNWQIDDRGDTAILRVEAGTPIAGIARRMTAMGWAGLEWAEGLPGSVGGAVLGNAGCYGGDIAGVLHTVRVMVDTIEEDWPVERMAYSYRNSTLKESAIHPSGTPPLILASSLRLHRSDPAALATTMARIASERKTKTPWGHSCGSVFRNPPGQSSGQMIERAGLKGMRVGNAEISRHHANYIINLGGASSDDVLHLITRVQETVQHQFGVNLELEVRVI